MFNHLFVCAPAAQQWQPTGAAAAFAASPCKQGTFGGAVFAMGDATYLQLKAVTMNNNTAAAGGAIATLGGSRVNCTADCTFSFNQAKVTLAGC
jgi:predicted outer membrane repeat protein